MPRHNAIAMRYLPVHQPVEGSDFMPDGWCGGCDSCGPAPKVCAACSYDESGRPMDDRVERWPCPVVLELCPAAKIHVEAARRYAELSIHHDYAGYLPGRGGAVQAAFHNYLEQEGLTLAQKMYVNRAFRRVRAAMFKAMS